MIRQPSPLRVASWTPVATLPASNSQRAVNINGISRPYFGLHFPKACNFKLTKVSSSKLTLTSGLEAASAALRPAGVLAVWSTSPAQAFARRLAGIGFNVDEHRTAAEISKGGKRTIWLAQCRNHQE